MLNFLNNKKQPQCPVDHETRIWMEGAFLWVVQQFGEQRVLNKKVLLPEWDDFSIDYNGSKDSLIHTAEIVAKQMDIDVSGINLEIYEESIKEIRGGMGHSIFTELDPTSEEKLAAGLYFGKNENGQYDVFIERNQLRDPEGLVATLAHEFAHIKLLGENRILENDEDLTDLMTVLYGFGIFNANSCFKFKKGFDTWSHNNTGYLKQQEWGYALALYAYFRKEEAPGWTKYLSPNIRSDFKKSEAFIYANTDKVFIEE